MTCGHCLPKFGKQYAECLMLAQTFENYWAYVLFSEDELYSSECRQALIQFIESLEALPGGKTDIPARAARAAGEKPDSVDLIPNLKDWAAIREGYPFGDIQESREKMRAFLSNVKKHLIEYLGFEQSPVTVSTSREERYDPRVQRWKPHLPRRILRRQDLRTLVTVQASISDTIVVVGDIRRSQDLMTYAEEPGHFECKMSNFIADTRENVFKHSGIFDKFTGDGFLVYFNKAICEAAGAGHQDYLKCFLDFTKDQRDFCAKHFREWEKGVRKLSGAKGDAPSVGLAMGADHGKVRFTDEHDHFIAVSPAIVWADRMASNSRANEVLVNNLLFHALKDSPLSVEFEVRTGQTKAGERFVARLLKFQD